MHSAKDVPAELPDGLELVAAPPRADPRDALCGRASLDELPAGARVGTSSVRRAAQLRALRDDLEVAELRGNVDTRLRRLAEGGYDAIVLALAGLQRLGRAGEAGGTLDALVPAAGQGVLVLTARTGDERAQRGGRGDLRRRDDDLPARRARRRPRPRGRLRHAGRRPRRALGGRAGPRACAPSSAARTGRPGCATTSTAPAGDPEALGAEVARRLRAAGADEVLGRGAGTGGTR